MAQHAALQQLDNARSCGIQEVVLYSTFETVSCLAVTGLVNPAATYVPEYGWVLVVVPFSNCSDVSCPLQVKYLFLFVRPLSVLFSPRFRN